MTKLRSILLRRTAIRIKRKHTNEIVIIFVIILTIYVTNYLSDYEYLVAIPSYIRIS